MALKTCRECGAKVSTSASRCPFCGAAHPTRSLKIYLKIALISVALLPLLFFGLTSFEDQSDDCKEFVIFVDAGQSYIHIWTKPTSLGKGRSIGKAAPGSLAFLLGEDDQDYKVESLLDHSVGWVKKNQITRIVTLTAKTHRPCP